MHDDLERPPQHRYPLHVGCIGPALSDGSAGENRVNLTGRRFLLDRIPIGLKLTEGRGQRHQTLVAARATELRQNLVNALVHDRKPFGAVGRIVVLLDNYLRVGTVAFQV